MRLTALVIAILITLTACTQTVVPISGTPTADQVLSNARRVAHQLDSYRGTVTVAKTTHYLKSPELDFTESTVQNVEMSRENQYFLHISPEFEIIFSDGFFYSWQESHGWTVERAHDPLADLFSGEFSPLPGGHPELLLDRTHLGEPLFGGVVDLDGRSVYLIEALVPAPPPGVGRSSQLILSDPARFYIDPDSFEVVRVEVDREIEDSLREDVGFQVIPGVVEIGTVDTYEYFDHHAEVEIALPDIQPPT